MTHEVQNVENPDGTAGPDCPAPNPDPQQEEPCIGVLTGKAHGCLEIEGKVEMECCCPRLYTRTMIFTINPGSDPGAQAVLQTTVSNYEANGYLVLGHSLVDIGAGWLVGLTIGWYA